MSTLSSSFQEIIEAIEKLSIDDQVRLVKILQQRYLEMRMDDVSMISEARPAYQPERKPKHKPGDEKRKDELKFLVSLDQDEDEIWVAECPAIPGCVSQGYSKDEAMKNIVEAIRLCLDVREELGFPLTAEILQVEVSA